MVFVFYKHSILQEKDRTPQHMIMLCLLYMTLGMEKIIKAYLTFPSVKPYREHMAFGGLALKTLNTFKTLS